MPSNILSILTDVLIILNILFTVIIVFYERKSPGSTWAWLMVTLAIPYFGFILYLLFGREGRKTVLFASKARKDDTIVEEIRATELEGLLYRNKQAEIFEHKNVLGIFGAEKLNDLVHLNFTAGHAPLTNHNEIEMFFNGEEKFNSMFEDIEKAQSHVHLLYYIVRYDELSQKLVNALIKKAKQGVRVRFMMDGMGSRGANTRKMLKLLKDAGGEVEIFLPPNFMRVNFRNHRKVCVIDGKIGYLGGLNIGDEYLGKVGRYGFWRDTHMRVVGDAVKELQIRFMLDWNFYAANKMELKDDLFPKSETSHGALMQIVSSGPDTIWSGVQYGYCKMISEAERKIYIQTPYFVPDDSVFELLRISALAGIDVRVVIPGNPDHPFVYWASLSYLGDLLNAGVKCYEYKKGFLHSKLIVVDSLISSVGTANMDIRSFRLNFEINSFIYDEKTALQLENRFIKDLEDCQEIMLESYAKRTKLTKIKESISRLLSPLL